MTRFIRFAIFAIGIVLGSIYLFPYFGKPSVKQLVQTVLHAPEVANQLKAARELSNHEKNAALPGLRQVLEESHNENVIAVCILGVARVRDYQLMEVILAKLNDDSVTVRAAAAKAAIKLIGRNYHFPIKGHKSERAIVIERMVADWNEYNGSELFEYNKKRFD